MVSSQDFDDSSLFDEFDNDDERESDYYDDEITDMGGQSQYEDDHSYQVDLAAYSLNDSKLHRHSTSISAHMTTSTDNLIHETIISSSVSSPSALSPSRRKSSAARSTNNKNANKGSKVYTLNTILKESDTRRLFFNFLNEHHNEEVVLFLEDEKQYRIGFNFILCTTAGSLLTEYEKKTIEIQRIYDTFIKPGSKNELNLSSSTREYMEKVVAPLMIRPPALFETEVKISLKNHILPLFLDSDLFEKFLLQKHIQENTVTNLKEKKVQKMLGYHDPRADIAIDRATKMATIGYSPGKTRSKKKLKALFGGHQDVDSNNSSPSSSTDDLSEPTEISPRKQDPTGSLAKFKNWIFGKKTPTTTNTSSPIGQKSSSWHTKLGQKQGGILPTDDNLRRSHSVMSNASTSSTVSDQTTERDGTIYIKVQNKKRGTCKVMEFNIDKLLAFSSEQERLLSKKLKQVLSTHTDPNLNPFDKYVNLREFLQTKISVQVQKNWEEVNQDCIIKVKSSTTSLFFKL